MFSNILSSSMGGIFFSTSNHSLLELVDNV
jgi:hypothetical protein